jgi:hypothetical protein
MSHEDEEQEKRGFKVQDRRRFSDSGEARPEPTDTPAAPTEQAPPPEPGRPAGPSAEAAAHAAPPFEMNFSTFVISLSTQALAHLGEIPHPVDNQVAIDLAAAKHMIDILGILKTKTQGNLDASESALLDNMLYDLRIKYVEHARGSA